MSQLLVILAASIFLVLGMIHGLLTLKDLKRPRAFTPRDPGLRTAMQNSGIALHPAINLWDAWMGFNLTHSLGIVMFAATYLYVGIVTPGTFAQSGVLQVCAISVSAIYWVISLRFFFSKPAIGSAVAMTCFVLATAISYV